MTAGCSEESSRMKQVSIIVSKMLTLLGECGCLAQGQRWQKLITRPHYPFHCSYYHSSNRNYQNISAGSKPIIILVICKRIHVFPSIIRVIRGLCGRVINFCQHSSRLMSSAKRKLEFFEPGWSSESLSSGEAIEK
jgi:hypothetical protein